MNNNTLKDYFNNEQEWQQYLQDFNVRKIINIHDKQWLQKLKRYYRIYGWDMILYPDQKRRLDLIKKELENARSN